MTLFPDLVTSLSWLGVTALLAYLLGAIPFGLMSAQVFNLGDLRTIGSGNIGATNVLRTGHKIAALLTLILDSGKGALAVLLARVFYGEDAAQIAGLAAFIGHCYPVYLRFKGGKGVATFLGTLLMLSFPVGLAACTTWLLIAFVFRFSSLAALGAAVFAPLWALMLGVPHMVALCGVLAALVLWRHRANIRRLIDGTEPKIGQS